MPTGPSRSPSTVLMCAASAPSPIKLSPISIGPPPLPRITLEWSKPNKAQSTGTRGIGPVQKGANLATYILKRLGLALVTLWLLSVIVFLACQVLPGDPGRAILGH